MDREDDLNISHEDLRTILTRPIAFHRLFADIAGSVGGGVFLSQLYYWSERAEDPAGWIYKTTAEWYEETMLTRRELDSIRRELKDKGVIKEKLAGVPATVHYKIEWNELFYCLKLASQTRREKIKERRVKNVPQTKGSCAPKRQTEGTKAPNQSGETRQSTNRSETSSETTTETKTTNAIEAGKKLNGQPAAAVPSSSSISLPDEAREKSTNGRNGMRSIPVDSLDLANSLAEKGKLSDSQRDKLAAHISHSEGGRAYVLQCEAIADSEPRKNWARAFMAAFRDRWQPAVSTIQSKTAKSRQSHQPRQAEPDPRENLSDEQLVAKTEPLRRLRESSGRA